MHDGQVQVNDPIRPRELTTIQGEQITIPVPEFRTHLQFRRFAGCPGCNLHLRSIAKRHDEILGAGLREVVVFYSSAQAMKPHQLESPSISRRGSRASSMYPYVPLAIAAFTLLGTRSCSSPSSWGPHSAIEVVVKHYRKPRTLHGHGFGALSTPEKNKCKQIMASCSNSALMSHNRRFRNTC